MEKSNKSNNKKQDTKIFLKPALVMECELCSKLKFTK